MKLHALLSVCAIAGLGAVATLSHAQAPAKPSAEPAPAAAAAPVAKAPVATTTAAESHMAKAHVTKAHTHKRGMAAHAYRRHETAYHVALRHCAEGPQAKKDHCLDEAIARYGRT